MKCIIKGCDNPATHWAVIDIGPTVGDSLVPDDEREHKVRLCDEHHRLMSPSLGPGSITFGKD